MGVKPLKSIISLTCPENPWKCETLVIYMVQRNKSEKVPNLSLEFFEISPSFIWIHTIKFWAWDQLKEPNKWHTRYLLLAILSGSEHRVWKSLVYLVALRSSAMGVVHCVVSERKKDRLGRQGREDHPLGPNHGAAYREPNQRPQTMDHLHCLGADDAVSFPDISKSKIEQIFSSK